MANEKLADAKSGKNLVTAKTPIFRNGAHTSMVPLLGKIISVLLLIGSAKTRPILLDHCIQILRLFTHGTRRYNNENSN